MPVQSRGVSAAVFLAVIAAAIAAVAPVIKLRRPVEEMLESVFSFMISIVENASLNSKNFECALCRNFE